MRVACSSRHYRIGPLDLTVDPLPTRRRKREMINQYTLARLRGRVGTGPAGVRRVACVTGAAASSVEPFRRVLDP
jgi:hypothetical protein